MKCSRAACLGRRWALNQVYIEYREEKCKKCIGRESNPGLADTVQLDCMATANFTTKPPMLDGI